MLYETIVVGAGIEGSATAYHLVKRGLEKVILIEQFSACHSRGSSCGQSRITRKAYETLFYIEMMNEAYKLWNELEKESGVTLYKCTGVLVFGKKNSPYLQATADSLRRGHISHEVFSADEANRRYSHQLRIPDTHMCILEKDGGILYAQRALRVFQQEFLKQGGTLLEHHRVTEIIPGDVVTVVTNRGTFKARNVVIAAGPWAPALCSSIGVHLPFKVSRIEVNYWKVDDPRLFLPSSFPTFLYASKDHFSYYGIPAEEYPDLLKVCAHFGETVDPDSSDSIGGTVTTSDTSEFISQMFKGVAKQPSITEFCLYTLSPDWHPVIDRHPQHKNIVIAAGFSGHGFKLSPVVGKVIAELVMREVPSYDLHPFSVSRFQTPKPSL